MNRMILALALSGALIPCTAPACVGSPSVALQLGAIGSYAYPLEPAGGRAVGYETAWPVLSVRASSAVAPRWQVVVGAQYWAGDGRVTLPKFLEAPDREVETRLVPLSAGVRFQPGPLDRSVRLYLGLAPTLAILHTKVAPTDFTVEGFGLGSATYLARAATMDASLDVSLSQGFALQFTVMYLVSSGFDNSEGLIIDRDFEGISELAALAGVRFGVY